ncbi:hypothetical protein ACQP1G_30590 [Nocardia sp. CA-107356]|uniref:hypothetical protein n=1 Tax=Nocardia sp. CA-107356 TaxID=3239972 RepID=UPI003D9434A2
MDETSRDPQPVWRDSGTPSWWDKIVDYVEGEVWPNAKTDTLADAGTGWSWCAEQLNTHLNFQPTRDAIGNQQTSEVQQILDQITLLETQGNPAHFWHCNLASPDVLQPTAVRTL